MASLPRVFPRGDRSRSRDARRGGGGGGACDMIGEVGGVVTRIHCRGVGSSLGKGGGGGCRDDISHCEGCHFVNDGGGGGGSGRCRDDSQHGHCISCSEFRITIETDGGEAGAAARLSDLHMAFDVAIGSRRIALRWQRWLGYVPSDGNNRIVLRSSDGYGDNSRIDHDDNGGEKGGSRGKGGSYETGGSGGSGGNANDGNILRRGGNDNGGNSGGDTHS